MDREIYLYNDHLIDFRVQDRQRGTYTSGLTLDAYLSFNPTGSAITSSYLSGGATQSLVSVFTTSSVATVYSGTVTQSILTEVSRSVISNSTGSVIGSSFLGVALTEDPPCSGEYVGVIRGSDIAAALSATFDVSYNTELSSSAVTFSADTLLAGSTTQSVTMSVSGFTSSFTSSQEVPLVQSDDRSFGIFEIISSGSFLRVCTPMTLRTVRYS